MKTKVAIPVFGKRVSPRFDCATKILIYSIDGGKILEKKEVEIKEPHPFRKVTKLCSLGVNVVICGGMDEFCFNLLNFNGISVISWIAGGADETIELFLKGRLKPGMVMCAGGKRWRMGWRRGRHGPRWQI